MEYLDLEIKYKNNDEVLGLIRKIKELEHEISDLETQLNEAE